MDIKPRQPAKPPPRPAAHKEDILNTKPTATSTRPKFYSCYFAHNLLKSLQAKKGKLAG